jgi:helicase
MNRDEYLNLTYSRIENLVLESGFQNIMAQVRARAIREELLEQSADIAFTFDAKQVWKYCDFIFSEGAMLLDENIGDREQVLGWVKLAAQAFEFLSRFADDEKQELMLLSSALCYHIAGYQANAQCLTRQIEKQYPTKPVPQLSDQETDDIFTQLFRSSLLEYLKHNVAKLQITSHEAKNMIHDLQRETTQGITEGKYSYADLFSLTAHAYFQEFANTFCQFCFNGAIESLDAANEQLRQSLHLFQKSSDATLSTVVAEILTTLNMFRERSTWINVEKNAPELLSDPVWRQYLRNLAYDKSIIEFWASQVKAINEGILSLSDSYVVQMPTSAGKTFIAELSILAALTSSKDSKCLYIAPFRALVNEVETSLSENLSPLGFSVSNLMGGFEFNVFEEYLAVNSQVVVATPEKVDLLVRTHPEFFNNLSVVIVDEGHIIDEGISISASDGEDNELISEIERNSSLGRGALLEFLITRLKQKFPATKFMFLSAVMPDVNAQDFIEWLTQSSRESLRISEEERPSRQSIAKFQWIGRKNTNKTGQLEFLNLPKLPNGVNPFVPRFLTRQQYHTGEMTPTGRPQRASWPDTNNKSETTAMLAVKLAVSGPVLVFCATRRDAESVLKKLTTSLKYMEASGLSPLEQLKRNETQQLESLQMAEEWLGEDDDLVEALRYGVALHYGPLPDPVRRAVEDDFRSNKIRILVSTNTLGQGVNLPIKTAIIHSLERRWTSQSDLGETINHVSQVKKRDFWNICGRAGRAGKETEGQIVFVSITDHDEQLINDYAFNKEFEEVHSALYKLLINLIEKRIDQNQLGGYLDSHILAILVEELVDTNDELAVSSWLGSSLVGIQALRNGIPVTPLTSVINSTSRRIQEDVPEELRSIFAATGLSVRSCYHILDSVKNFARQASQSSATLGTSLVADYTLLGMAFDACKDLPEMLFDNAVLDDELAFLIDWVNGESVSTLRKKYWTSNDGTSLGEFLSERVTYKLPWGFNGFLHILSYVLGMQYEKLPLEWQHLPAMIKSGVNHVLACWTISIANVSRSFSLQIADVFPQQDEYTFPNFISWLVNLPTDYIVEQFDVPNYEKQKLIRELSNVVLDDHQLSFIRNGGRINAEIVGLYYHDIDAIELMSEGDEIELRPEQDNPYDIFAVKAVWNGRDIGYLQRNKSRIVSQELQLRSAEQVIVKTLRYRTPQNNPHVEVEIRLEG